MATLVATASAHADLVYDAQPVVIQQQAAPVQVQQQVQSQEPTLSRSELIRRERIRKEMQAEDVLSARMETLRLRDEERRVNSLIQQDTQGAQVVAQSAAPQQVVVTTQAAPVAVTAAPEQVSVMPATGIVDNSSEDDLRVAITPRGGISNLAVQSNYPFTVNPFYAFGGQISAYSGRFAVDLGYTYSLFGIGMMSMNPYVQPLQYQYTQFAQNPLELRQHLFEAGGRFFLTQSKLRPYVGGTVGYSRGYINYSGSVQNILGPYGLSQDYLLEQYLAGLQAGIELKLGHSAAVNFLAKYNFVFSNRQSQPIYGYYGGIPIQDIDKMNIAGAIAQTGSYSFQLGLSLFL